MREITDRKRIERWVAAEGLREKFDTPGLQFQAYQYEKKELVTVPGQPQEKLLFLVKGTLLVYGIRDDGSLSPVNTVTKPALLGDMEFSGALGLSFFVEAKTATNCLALSLGRYRESLEKDVRFLHMVLHSLAEKLELFSSLEAMPATIRERVLYYMRAICLRGELAGVENATLSLRCSRRQLQRTLKELCEEGMIEKVGKGHYRLKER